MDDINKIKQGLLECQTQRRVMAKNNAEQQELLNITNAKIVALQRENNQLLAKKSTSSKCTQKLAQCQSIKNELSEKIGVITSELAKLQDQLQNLRGVCKIDLSKMKVEYENQQKEILKRISELTETLGKALENYSKDSNLNGTNFGKLVNQGYKYGCVREMDHFKKIYKKSHKNTQKKVKSKR
jgi:hypothetical protein